MPRSRPGSGSVFQRTYRDSHGKLRKTKNWYIEFVSGNRTIRKLTQFTKRSDAAKFLGSASPTRWLARSRWPKLSRTTTWRS